VSDLEFGWPEPEYIRNYRSSKSLSNALISSARGEILEEQEFLSEIERSDILAELEGIQARAESEIGVVTLEKMFKRRMRKGCLTSSFDLGNCTVLMERSALVDRLKVNRSTLNLFNVIRSEPGVIELTLTRTLTPVVFVSGVSGTGVDVQAVLSDLLEAERRVDP